MLLKKYDIIISLITISILICCVMLVPDMYRKHVAMVFAGCFILFLLFVFERFYLYVFWASFFIGYPLYINFPFAIYFTDLVLIVILVDNILRSISTKKKIKTDILLLEYLLGAFIVICIISYWINFGEHSFLYQMNGIWHIIRLSQPLLMLYLFKNKNYHLSHNEIFAIFYVMTLLQLPVIMWQLKQSGMQVNFQGFTGTFSSHHAGIGTFMLIPLSLAYHFFMRAKSMFQKINIIIFQLIVLYLILLSQCRSALVGLLFIIANIFIFKFKLKRKHLIAIVMLLVLSIPVVIYSPLLTTILNTIKSDTTGSLDVSSLSRFLIWRDTYHNFMDLSILRKFFGIGVYFSGETLLLSFFYKFDRFITSPHNNFLTALYETGIIGFILFISIYVTIIISLFKRYKKYNDNYAFSLFILSIALLSTSVTQETLWSHPFMGSLLMCYFVLLAHCFYTKNVDLQKIEVL